MDIFIEGLDAQTGGYRLKAVSTQVDDFDLHQAYIALHDILGTDVDIKAGRQELKYGKGRLIGAPAWSNRMRVFDAGVLRYHHEALSGDLFYGQDMKYDDDKFNNSRQEEFISGFYGGYQKNKTAPLVETYFLTQKDIKGSNDVQRYTVGARLLATVAPGTVVDIEAPYQFGHSGSATATKREIKSYAFHADVAKTWDAAWKPKLTVGYDEASGDKDPNDSVNETFVPLYQSTHEAYGLLDYFRWQNVRNPEVGMTFSPTDKFRFTTQADFFWLQSKYDSWYNSSGSVIRSKTTGERDYFVGSEVSLRLFYDLNKYLKLETGYAHFFPGGFARDSGADDDIDWVYSQAALKF
ncbi:MAG: alginate export family protein, partial [Candidatus Omnitrophica bacterium]|nr:alginate export family protein [Candidatus Omnitrophota bacterium]